MNKSYIFATVSLIVVAAGFTGWILAQRTSVQITQTKVFAGGGNNCELENICGDGQITGTEFCDNGGICTGSSNAAFEGRHCFDIDPTGYNIWGVQRCVATGGRCIPQNGDGCSSDCSEKCYTNSVPCMIDADCGTCGAVCTSGVCTGTENYWKVTVSGILTGAGYLCHNLTDCGVYNVTDAPLEDNGSDLCSGFEYCWDNETVSSDCGTWSLKWDDTVSRWALEAGPTEDPIYRAVYVHAAAGWSCSSPNVMTQESTVECMGWPATITVTPIGVMSCP